MRLKLRYILPLVQMALAVEIIQWTNHWYETVGKFYDSPGSPDPVSFLTIMSAPASVAREIWFPIVPWQWSNVVYVASIGLCWYWVAMSVSLWRRHHTLFPFPRIRLRIAADLLFIGMSMLFVELFRNIDIRIMPWKWEIPCLTLFLAWSLGPIVICCRDLSKCFPQRESSA